jgi:YVTN family beta-propeller protein
MRANLLVSAMLLGATLAACGNDASTTVVPPADLALAQRAYVVARDSDELDVIDLKTLAIVGKVSTGGFSSHMAELNRDFSKVYVSSPETNEVIVLDARTLKEKARIPVGQHPTHMSLAPDGSFMAVMLEWEGAVSIVDVAKDVVKTRIDGFVTPHFMRYSKDGRHGYVANAGASRVTRVDLATFTVDAQLTLDGVDADSPVADEGGFHDAQVDADGVLYAAHAATGRVLVYDTVRQQKMAELQVGAKPWIVFAEHPFKALPHRYLVPNLGDRTVSRIDGAGLAVAGSLEGDEESYGVNYSSLAPDRAYVMNRVREDIAVVDTATGAITKRIPVGGNTETAATTADGKYVVAAVSGANRVVVIDAVTSEIVKTFDHMAAYPWSVTIPLGQNYCH